MPGSSPGATRTTRDAHALAACPPRGRAQRRRRIRHRRGRRGRGRARRRDGPAARAPIRHERRGSRSAMRVGSPVPGDRLGGVPRLFVLREQADDGSRELLVQRGEHERKRGLGDAGGHVGKSARNARKGSLEASSWTRPESADVDVHAAGGNGVPRGHGIGGSGPDGPIRLERRARSKCRRSTYRYHPNHPQGHPRCPTSTLSENPCPVGNDTVEKPCRLEALRFAQLKRCCVTSRPP